MTEHSYSCEICGLDKADGQHWFLVSTAGGHDRVSVLHWDEATASHRGVHPVCSSEHARELVARWVLSGTLCCGARGSRWRIDPASASGPADSCCRPSPPLRTRCGDPPEADLKNLENAAPETLLAILDAVETVLEGRLQQLDQEEAQEEVLVYDA